MIEYDGEGGKDAGISLQDAAEASINANEQDAGNTTDVVEDGLHDHFSIYVYVMGHGVCAMYRKMIVEADPSKTTSELAAGFDVSDKTILIHLKQIGKVKNLEKWVTHELSELHQQTRLSVRYITQASLCELPGCNHSIVMCR